MNKTQTLEDAVNKAKQIKLFIFDVDGILTDGSLYLTDDNIEMKAFHSHDGLGMKLLQKTGVKIAIITARKSNLVALRMKSLGIEHLYQGNMDKTKAYEVLLKKLKLQEHQIGYAGDDILDLPLMNRTGLSITVPNAHDFVKPYADWITTKAGGQGAAREICDFIMHAQETFDSIYQSYLTSA